MHRHAPRLCAPREARVVTLLRAGVFAAVVGLALCLAACGSAGGPGVHNAPKGGTGSNDNAPSTTVNVGNSGFEARNVAITHGTAIIFASQPNAEQHDVCLGATGSCDEQASGPSSLQDGGIFLAPGKTRAVIFPHVGTYHLTTVPQSAYDLTVTVR